MIKVCIWNKLTVTDYFSNRFHSNLKLDSSMLIIRYNQIKLHNIFIYILFRERSGETTL